MEEFITPYGELSSPKTRCWNPMQGSKDKESMPKAWYQSRYASLIDLNQWIWLIIQIFLFAIFKILFTEIHWRPWIIKSREEYGSASNKLYQVLTVALMFEGCVYRVVYRLPSFLLRRALQYLGPAKRCIRPTGFNNVIPIAISRICDLPRRPKSEPHCYQYRGLEIQRHCSRWVEIALAATDASWYTFVLL